MLPDIPSPEPLIEEIIEPIELADISDNKPPRTPTSLSEEFYVKTP